MHREAAGASSRLLGIFPVPEQREPRDSRHDPQEITDECEGGVPEDRSLGLLMATMARRWGARVTVSNSMMSLTHPAGRSGHCGGTVIIRSDFVRPLYRLP
jgi:hypothetical protein